MVRRRLLIAAVILFVLGAMAQLNAQSFVEDKPIAHEPLPRPDGLVAGTTSDPVFVFDEGDDETGLPSELIRDGRRLPAPSGEGDDDLLYRSAPASGVSDPGTVHTVEREIWPDRATGRQPWLNYHAVFDPALIPFKRNAARDHLQPDGALVVGDSGMTRIQLFGNRAVRGREQFWGSIQVELESGTTIPIPSVSPESRILSAESTPRVALHFYKDGADNFFVSAGGYSGRVKINFLMDAPTAWFSRPLERLGSAADVPARLRPVLPSTISADVNRVIRRIGVSRTATYGKTLRKLVAWFRSFKPGSLGPDSDRSLYAQIALSRKGICRHRVYAFVITAMGLGIPSRYVSNEAHVFAEVYLPGAVPGWLRIDLGGGALGMTVRGGARKTRHTQVADDPFGFPEGFTRGYSHRALMGLERAQEGADMVTGLPPAGGRGSSASGVSPAGRGSPSDWSHRNLRVSPRVGDKPTVTTLKQVSAQVFRGEKLALEGKVMSGTAPVVGGGVRIVLLDSRKWKILKYLGYATTDANGHFATSLIIPQDLALGTWEVAAEFLGDKSYAPSGSD